MGHKSGLPKPWYASLSLRSYQPVMGSHQRRLLGLLAVCVIITVIYWGLLQVHFLQMVQIIHRVMGTEDCRANATWIRECQDLLKQHAGCADAEVLPALAHCEITMDISTQEIRKRRSLPLLTPWLAPIVWEGTFDAHLLDAKFNADLEIGLTVFAVKKYVMFLQKFLESAEKYFMVGLKVHYYIFTDQPEKVPTVFLHAGRCADVLRISAHSPWQEISMRRMEVLSLMAKRRFYNEVHYLVCADVDMVFSDRVGVEILGKLVATLHPGFFTSLRAGFPYEQRPKSQAFVGPDEGDFYYMGAFFAGTVVQIYQLAEACHRAIMEDKSHGIEAVWHEESHLNRYLIDHKPTKVLSPEYIWDMKLPHGDLVKRKRFLAVTKNHVLIRS